MNHAHQPRPTKNGWEHPVQWDMSCPECEVAWKSCSFDPDPCWVCGGPGTRGAVNWETVRMYGLGERGES